MFNQSKKRIGFCCKYLDPDQTQKPKILKEKQQNYTEKVTTVAWCNRQEKNKIVHCNTWESMLQSEVHLNH